jgi:23S rRNA (adenine2503-C2)-methyltransferase
VKADVVSSEPLPFERPVAAATTATIDLASADEAGLGALIAACGEKPFRAKQLFAWLHGRRATSLDAMTDLPAALRTTLAARGAIRRPIVDDVKVAADGTRKYQLRTHDGHIIESVWIPHASGPGRHALCISSQVGCAMGCAFCATAALNLTRHLEPGEIVGQVYAVLDELDRNQPEDPPLPSSKLRFRYDPEADDERSDSADGDDVGEARAGGARPAPRLRPRRVQNIVYMGMGEPLHNLDNVIASIRLLTHAEGYGLSPRRITVSTSGMVSALARLGAETGVHLAISLNATTNDVRCAIMPVTKRWDLQALLAACAEFPLERRRRITFEYVMLAGVNDTDDDARRLVELLRGQRSKVNLIPFNAHPLSPYARPSDDRVEAFRAILDRAGLSCFVRTTRGLDIDAACGMLGAKKLESARASLPVIG